jgi:hypothetical protein
MCVRQHCCIVAVRHLCCAEENPSRKGEAMTKFKVGDVVRIVGGSSRKWKIDSFADGKARIVFRKKLDYGMQLVDVKNIVLVDPQADMKQAIREVLLSDEFMTTFAAAFRSATVPRSTFEHPVPGVNRPMRTEAQLSKMVEMVRQSLTTESNSPKILDSSSDPWTPKVGERVRLIETGDIYEIESYSETYAQYSMQGWPGSCVNLEDIEPVKVPEVSDSSSEPTPKPSKTQPPSNYRMLGSAKDEPRQASDLYWSLSAKNWVPIESKQVEYANRDDWAACRKIEVTSPPPKRYREPTLADLTSGPIACEYRDDKDEQWKSGLLVYVLDQVYPFLCVNKERIIAVQWRQCQIEVTE